MARPGPALLVAMRSTLASGRIAGLATGAGLACVAALWTLAALLGLDILFVLFPWAFTTVKTAGALYLLWTALNIWRRAKLPIGPVPETRNQAFLTGALVNLTNSPNNLLSARASL